MIKLIKLISHLIIDMIMLIQVNLLIDDRLLFHNELKNCKLYHDNYRLIQCFNYQKYNHIIKIYHNIQKYNICVILEYNNYNCSLKNSFFIHYYINYNSEYSAWFIKYRICKKQLEKIWLAYIIRLRKFIIIINKNYLVDMHLLTSSSFTFLQISQNSQNNSQNKEIIILSELWQTIIK